MEQIDYSELLPVQPDVDLVKWLTGQGAFKQEYLIYKAGSWYDPLEGRRKRAVEVGCTSCEERFFADKAPAGDCRGNYRGAPFGWIHPETHELLTSGSDTLCPCCGAQVNTIHISCMGRSGITMEAWATKLARLPVPGKRDRLTVTDWLVRRRIERDGRKTWSVWPYTAYVVEEKKLVRLMGYTRFINSVSLFGRWEQRRNYLDCTGQLAYLYPFDPSLPDGTTAENCRVDLYLDAGGTRPVSWLALWRKHPAAENLLVQGAGRLTAELLDAEIHDRSYNSYSGYGGNAVGVPRMDAIDWKQRRPAQMLGLNKDEFRCLVAQGLGRDGFTRYRLARDAGIAVRLPEDLWLLKKLHMYALREMVGQVAPEDFWRTVRYLERQHGEWIDLRDYWRMAGQLGRDMDEGLVRWPRRLKEAHDRCANELARIRREKEAALEEERRRLRALDFEARAKKLEHLAWASDGLLIRPCASEEELIREGKELHHCVATYAKAIVEGRSAILFIRREEAPDEPWYTLELDEVNMTVRQDRGLRNCNRTPEVEAFEAKWLEWAREQKLKKRRKKKEKEAKAA